MLSELQRAVILAALVMGAFALAFVDGIGPGDAEHYLSFARAWAEGGTPLGTNHWQLRWPMIWSLAGGMAVFGTAQTTGSLVCLAWSAALVGVTFWGARRSMGPRAGNLAAILAAGSAYLVVVAADLRIYAPEIALGAAACWAMVRGLEAGRARWLLAAGALAGAAWLCRETSAALPVLFGLLSLARFRRPCARLFASSAGFLAVLAAEGAAYALVAGDPLYRLRISAGHEAAGASAGGQTGADASLVGATQAPLTESPLAALLSTPVVTPFLLACAALLLCAWLVRGRPLRLAGMGWTGAVFFGGAALSFVLSSYGLRLETPRYVPLLPYAVTLGAAWALSVIGRARGQRWTMAGAAGWLALSAAAADFRDYDEYADVFWLARHADEADRLVTDPVTALRVRAMRAQSGRPPLRIAGRREARPGDLAAVTRADGYAGGLRPLPCWTLEAEVFARRRSVTRDAVRASGLGALSGAVAKRVVPTEPLRLYRVEDCGPGPVGRSAGPPLTFRA